MDWSQVPACKTALDQGVASIQCLEPLFANILTVVTSLAGIGLFVMLSIAGFRYLTSGGDPKASESAKNTMTYAFLGMILMGVAYLIFRLIGSFTGVGDQLLHFSIPTPGP